jgi:hypothetical protein
MRRWIDHLDYEAAIQSFVMTRLAGYERRFRAEGLGEIKPDEPFFPKGEEKPYNYKLKVVEDVMRILSEAYKAGLFPETLYRIARLLQMAWTVSSLAIIPADSQEDAETVARDIELTLLMIMTAASFPELGEAEEGPPTVIELRAAKIAASKTLAEAWERFKEMPDEEEGLVWQLARIMAFTPTVWPVLVGTTGAGKATLASWIGLLMEMVMRARGMMKEESRAYAYVPLMTVDPETGWELVTLQDGRISAKPRDTFLWARANPFLLCFDELDKADPHNFYAKVVLPIMDNYIWGESGRVPPEHLLILGGMNYPPNATAWVNQAGERRNFTARCVFIPFPPTDPESVGGLPRLIAEFWRNSSRMSKRRNWMRPRGDGSRR